MASAHLVRPGSFLSPQYVHGVYIPSALLIVGTAIVKMEWVIYAVAMAALLGAWKVYNNRTSAGCLEPQLPSVQANWYGLSEVKKALRPDSYQEFELKEKTIISPNVAM